MTWYAHHLFAEASPSLLENFLASPVMSRDVYWIRDLTDYPWTDPRIKHELPPNGLLVVRPIGDPSSHAAGWYEHHIISWFDVQGSETPELRISPVWLQQNNPDYGFDAFPPPEFLKYLKQLSIDHKSTLAFYHCFMWGGDTEIEFAWVFRNGDEIAYSGVEFRKYPNVIIEYRQNGEIVAKEGSVLADMLSNFAIDLPTPFFALHTRDFPWESFRAG